MFFVVVVVFKKAREVLKDLLRRSNIMFPKVKFTMCVKD